MVIDAQTGRLGWLPQARQAGTQRVVVRVADQERGISLQSFDIEVDAANTPPVITSLPSPAASPGNLWEYRLHVQDADGDSVAFQLETLATGMTLTPLSQADSQAVLRFTPTAAGTVDVVLIAQDGRGGRDEQRFTINGSASANVAPEIVSQPRRIVTAGRPWVYVVSAQDPNSDPISLSLSNAPAGMAFNAQTQIANWTPTLAQLGVHVFSLNASDNRGGGETQSITVTVVPEAVNEAPRIRSTPPAFRGSVGQSFAYDLQAVDADGDPVEWTLVEAPYGASIDRRYGTLRWTPSIEQLGLQRFVVSAEDPLGGQALQSFSLNVSGVNLSPSLLSRAPSEAVADQRYVYGIWAVDPENDPLVFALGNAPAGMTIDAQRGIIRWTPTAAQ